MDARAFVEVACQVCGAADATPAYEREFESAALGRVRMRLVQCASCGFLYASPRPTREDLSAHYRDSCMASGAVWHASGAGSRHELLTSVRTAFVQRVLGGEGGRMLDVGCSRGDLLCGFDACSWERVGLEPSAAAAAEARERGLEVFEVLLEENDLPARSFELVTCVSVLEHVWDVRDSLAALARLLRPGGHLFLDVPDSARPTAQISEFYSFEHLSHFTEGTLTRLLVRHGFRPLETERREGSGIMVGARFEGIEGLGDVVVPDDGAELARSVERYQHERERFEGDVRRRFETLVERWEREDRRVAIYGAGEHTLFLLDLVDFGDRIAAVLDTDPSKQGGSFLRWRVSAPEEAARLGIDTVVLSSKPYQDEMHAAIAPVAEAHGIEVVRCYPAAAPAA